MAESRCCVIGCTSTSNSHKLTRIPRTDSRRDIWLIYLIPYNPRLKLLTRSSLINKKVCQLHFECKFLNTFRTFPTLFTEQEFFTGRPSIPLVFKEDDFVRLWMGLFHAVWNSDKPLVQEELCEDISSIMDVFPPSALNGAALMMQAGLRVLATRWYGIDQHRMDKFLMLVRRLLRGWLRYLKSCSWSLKSCEMSTKLLTGDNGLMASITPVHARNALSLRLHFTEIFLEEIAKISNGEVPNLVELLRPFAQYLASGTEHMLVVSCRKYIFNALIRQSELGQQYEDKRRAWQGMKCPEGGPDALERVEDSDDDDRHSDQEFDDDKQSKALDPRAGRVDVILNTIQVPAASLASLLNDLAKNTTSSTHTRLKMCANRFEQLSKGDYPLKTEAISIDLNSKPLKTRAKRRCAEKLRNFEKKLISDSDELNLRGVNKKQKKRILKAAQQAIHTANGEWQIENTLKKLKKKKSKTQTETSSNNKENTQTKKAKKRPLPAAQTNGDVSPKKQKLYKENDKKTTNKPESTKTKLEKTKAEKKKSQPTVLVNKVKNFSKDTNKINKTNKKPKPIITPQKKSPLENDSCYSTPKNVKFALKNNSKQGLIDYYKSIKKSPSIPFDGTKKPVKTNLKPNSTPSPINPFHKKKLRMRN